MMHSHAKLTSGSSVMPRDRRAPTVRLRRLAAELRSLRTSTRLARDEIVERTGINVATLYRREHARVRPQTRTFRTLLDHCGVKEAHHDTCQAWVAFAEGGQDAALTGPRPDLAAPLVS
jgi:transcriptional regulator with XRE-family HTH domain